VGVELLATFAYCLASAVVWVMNAEAYLLVAATTMDVPIAWLALAAATGQVTGKMLFYLLGLGAVRTPWLQRKAVTRGRLVEWMRRLSAWCEAHPTRAFAVVAVSASVGLPPLAATSVLAGTLRMRWWVFAATAVAGRFLRFLLVLQVPGLFGYDAV
jgi:membrane protein YqaA with SNARE-associated domain